jgi:hypothetical protein
MRRAIKPATRAEQSYQDACRALGCVVCRFRIAHGMQDARDGQCGWTHIHHRNTGDLHGQKQLGQGAVVAMGGWHHDGVLFFGETNESMRERFGPSFAATPRDFRVWTDDVLPGYGRGTGAWQVYQDELLEANDGK